jgi:hypothetical protein
VKQRQKDLQSALERAMDLAAGGILCSTDASVHFLERLGEALEVAIGEPSGRSIQFTIVFARSQPGILPRMKYLRSSETLKAEFSRSAKETPVMCGGVKNQSGPSI